MESMAHSELEIKAALSEHLSELLDFVATSHQDNASAHALEQGLWKRLLKLGHEVLKQFFVSGGTATEFGGIFAVSITH